MTICYFVAPGLMTDSPHHSDVYLTYDLKLTERDLQNGD